MLFELAVCTNSTYDLCSPLTTPSQKAISELDPTQSGFFNTNASSTESVDTYYQATLNLSSGYEATSSQTQIGAVNFDLYGNDNSIYGNTPSGLDITQNDFLSMVSNKFPFAYMLQIYNIFNGLSNEQHAASLTPVTLTMFLPNGNHISATSTQNGGNALTALPVTVISQDEMYKIMPKSTWDELKLLEGAAIIIGTAFYFFHRIKNWKHGGGGGETA